MCAEFFLALLYFFILLGSSSLLIRLLLQYFKEIKRYRQLLNQKENF